MKYNSLELCAGAGGQAIGLEMAGFEHRGLVEIDPHACATLRTNRPHWAVIEEDLRLFSASPFRGIELVCAGVPCPPFSRAGAQLGAGDERDLFPEALRVIREVRPRAVLFENVRGILDRRFDGFRQHLRDAIKIEGLELRWNLLQAADFGVPQLRPRAVGVALTQEVWRHFSWPLPTLSRVTVGEALLDEMAAGGWTGAQPWSVGANQVAPTLVGGSKKHGGADLGPTRAKRQWRTLGIDAMVLADSAPHPGFAGMPRLTVRMAAILQGFPTDWKFSGGKTAAYRQVGNAFPPPVARAVGLQIRRALEMADGAAEPEAREIA